MNIIDNKIFLELIEKMEHSLENKPKSIGVTVLKKMYLNLKIEMQKAQYHGFDWDKEKHITFLHEAHKYYLNNLMPEPKSENDRRVFNIVSFVSSRGYAFRKIAQQLEQNINQNVKEIAIENNEITNPRDLIVKKKDIQDLLTFDELHPEYKRVLDTLESQLQKLESLNAFDIPLNPPNSIEGELDRIRKEENMLDPTVPMDWVVNHFLPMTTIESKANKKPYLTVDELNSIMKIGFLNEEADKIDLNYNPKKEARKVHSFFHEFYLKMGNRALIEFSKEDLFEFYSKCINHNMNFEQFNTNCRA